MPHLAATARRLDPLGEVAGRDRPGGAGHSLERTQPPAQHEPSAGAEDGDQAQPDRREVQISGPQAFSPPCGRHGRGPVTVR